MVQRMLGPDPISANKLGEETGVCQSTLFLYLKRKSRWGDAVQLLEAAASNGHAEGQYALALCYEYGIGVSKDMNKALTLYRQAANGGIEEAIKRIEKTAP